MLRGQPAGAVRAPCSPAESSPRTMARTEREMRTGRRCGQNAHLRPARGAHHSKRMAAARAPARDSEAAAGLAETGSPACTARNRGRRQSAQAGRDRPMLRPVPPLDVCRRVTRLSTGMRRCHGAAFKQPVFWINSSANKLSTVSDVTSLMFIHSTCASTRSS